MTDVPIQIVRSASVTLSLPCSLAAVRPALLEVRDFLRDQGIEAQEIQACELALAEACNNAIQYASGSRRWEHVQLEVSCDAGAVRLTIRDHTAGFDWPAEVTLPDPAQERGRGLFLIRSLMDHAQYYRAADANCLVLEKRRAAPHGPATLCRPGVEQMTHQLRESEQVISDMAEELSFCYESLSAIFRCSAELGRTHDLKEFSQRLLSDLAQITGSDWFVLRLLARDGKALGVFTASDPSLKLPPLMVRGPAVRPSLELRAALGRQDIWFDGEKQLDPGDPLSAYPGRITGLIHPFFLADQLIGTVAIGNLGGKAQFTAVHANVVHTFADFLGIQIANARFQEDQVHARLVSRELEIAKNIQRSLLPKSLPSVPGYELAGYCESAQQVGGDFYDVVKSDSNSFLLIVADVMGKGVPAAMFAAILRSLLRAVPEWTRQPAHLLSRLNRLLFR
jgi:anti-sigma regulatory factor (Ser/Thr protein kinase)